jgi:hypothetical protein
VAQRHCPNVQLLSQFVHAERVDALAVGEGVDAWRSTRSLLSGAGAPAPRPASASTRRPPSISS